MTDDQAQLTDRDLEKIRLIIREEIAAALKSNPPAPTNQPLPPALVDVRRAEHAAMEAREKSRLRREARDAAKLAAQDREGKP